MYTQSKIIIVKGVQTIKHLCTYGMTLVSLMQMYAYKKNASSKKHNYRKQRISISQLHLEKFVYVKNCKY